MSGEEKSSFKVHGMRGELVEPDWAPLTGEELEPVLREYGLGGGSVQLLSISPRPLSAAGTVGTPRGPVFVKRQARSVRDAAGLREEHRFIEHLRSRGVPVPEVLRTTGGLTAVESGGWTYEVHQAPPAVDLYADALSWTPFLSADHAWSAGRMLAKAHRAAEGFNAPARKPQPMVASFTIFAGGDSDLALESYLACRPGLAGYPHVREHCAEALGLLRPFEARLLPWLGGLPALWTHNDLHGSNLLWSGRDGSAEAVAIIDFGLSDRTNAAYDLAQAIDRSIVEWLDLAADGTDAAGSAPVHLDHLEAMLAGYEEVRPLSRPEAFALAPMTALGHAEFALSEADYFYGVLHAEERAAYACPDYLCGHARWFHGVEGQNLIEFLEERARRSYGEPAA